MKKYPPSKVPFFNFSSTLPEQENELERNPLLQRMKESRTRLEAINFVLNITMLILREI